MTTTTKRNYGLDLGSPVYFVVTCLEMGVGPEGSAPTLDAMATAYRHHLQPDLSRVKLHEGAKTDAEANCWLVEEALRELGKQVEVGDDGVYRLTRPVEEVRWPGQKLLRWQTPADEPPADVYDRGLTTGTLVNNFGRGGSKDDLSDLLDSMRTFGWIPEFPAIRDERGEILVGHRRLAAAAQLRAEGLDIEDLVHELRLGSDGPGRARAGRPRGRVQPGDEATDPGSPQGGRPSPGRGWLDHARDRQVPRGRSVNDLHRGLKGFVNPDQSTAGPRKRVARGSP